MNQELNAVREYMEATDQPVRHSPISQLTVVEAMQRLHHIRNEFCELREAMGVHEDEFGWHMDEIRKPLDPERCLAALSDLTTSVLACYHTLGLGTFAVDGLRALHVSDMTRVGHDGKVARDINGQPLKGPNYQRPDYTSVLSVPPSNPFSPTE